MAKKRAKKVKVVRVKQVAPDVHHVELEVHGGALPPSFEPPAEPLDMLAREPLPEAHKPWWSWLRDIF
jgi:hypothetical protein